MACESGVKFYNFSKLYNNYCVGYEGSDDDASPDRRERFLGPEAPFGRELASLPDHYILSVIDAAERQGIEFPSQLIEVPLTQHDLGEVALDDTYEIDTAVFAYLTLCVAITLYLEQPSSTVTPSVHQILAMDTEAAESIVAEDRIGSDRKVLWLNTLEETLSGRTTQTPTYLQQMKMALLEQREALDARSQAALRSLRRAIRADLQQTLTDQYGPRPDTTAIAHLVMSLAELFAHLGQNYAAGMELGGHPLSSAALQELVETSAQTYRLFYPDPPF